MIRTRKLENEEWYMLGDTELSPDKAVAIGAFNDGRLIGHIFLCAPVHCEGIFIEEQSRNGFVMAALVDEAEKYAKTLGITKLLAFAVNPIMADYISRLGYDPTPFSVFSKELTCQSAQ